jgi:hypothetical protein
LGTTGEELKTTHEQLEHLLASDDTSILENFRFVELEDPQGLLAEAIKTTRTHLTQLQSTQGLVDGHPRAHYPGGYWFRLLRGPPALPDSWVTMQDNVERKATED